jgi:sulfite oxidase
MAHDKHAELLVRQAEPFNGGPPLELLRAQFVTPNELFFVRNHGAVPAIAAADYRLRIDGEVERPLELSLAELRRLPRRQVIATLQCAGNRRSEMAAVEPIPGELPWGAEAISNARWSGVSLADLLASAGVRPAARHVAFLGLDECERHGERFGFGGSIPLEKAAGGEVLLADEMNGEPLPAVHGAPLRALVPGYIGARSVKWLGRITLQAQPSSNYFQAKAYRLFPPAMRPASVDYQQGLMLGESAVNSILCSPAEGARVAAGPLRVQGVAVAGGGREVARVDLSVDGGASWTSAELEPADERWAWRFFSGAVTLPGGSVEIVARAVDAAAHTQPEHPRQVWNFKGYMNNAWTRVRVEAT